MSQLRTVNYPKDSTLLGIETNRFATTLPETEKDKTKTLPEGFRTYNYIPKIETSKDEGLVLW